MLLLESINQVQTSVHLFQPARVKFYLLFFSRNLLRNIFQLDVAAFQPFGKFPGSRIYFLQARHCIQALFQYGKQTALIGVHRLTGTEQSGLYLFGMAQRIGLLLQFFLFSGSQMRILQLLQLETDVIFVRLVLFGLCDKLFQILLHLLPFPVERAVFT